MLAIEGALAKLDDLAGFLSSVPGQTVGGARLNALRLELFDVWPDALDCAARWRTAADASVTLLAGRSAALFTPGARQDKGRLLDAVQHLREDYVRHVFGPWSQSVWYHFRGEYPYLTADETPIVDESFRAHAAGCHRAAIVTHWCAAAYRMRDHVEHHMTLAGYNGHSTAVANSTHTLYRRFTRDYQAASRPELDEVPDAHILATLLHAGPLGVNAYQLLDQVRVTRNLCAHGGQVTIGALKSLSCFEDCFNNLFSAVPA